jgi:hypothetical protein
MNSFLGRLDCHRHFHCDRNHHIGLADQQAFTVVHQCMSLPLFPRFESEALLKSTVALVRNESNDVSVLARKIC